MQNQRSLTLHPSNPILIQLTCLYEVCALANAHLWLQPNSCHTRLDLFPGVAMLPIMEQLGLRGPLLALMADVLPLLVTYRAVALRPEVWCELQDTSCGISLAVQLARLAICSKRDLHLALKVCSLLQISNKLPNRSRMSS